MDQIQKLSAEVLVTAVRLTLVTVRAADESEQAVLGPLGLDPLLQCGDRVVEVSRGRDRHDAGGAFEFDAHNFVGSDRSSNLEAEQRRIVGPDLMVPGDVSVESGCRLFVVQDSTAPTEAMRWRTG